MLARNNRFLIIAVLLCTLALGQLAYAQDSGCAGGIPQWVRDRQEYETTYVYVPMTSDLPYIKVTFHIPQWVIDRQQYETSFVYTPMPANLQGDANYC
jgi:hypothetical protein